MEACVFEMTMSLPTRVRPATGVTAGATTTGLGGHPVMVHPRRQTSQLSFCISSVNPQLNAPVPTLAPATSRAQHHRTDACAGGQGEAQLYVVELARRSDEHSQECGRNESRGLQAPRRTVSRRLYVFKGEEQVGSLLSFCLLSLPTVRLTLNLFVMRLFGFRVEPRNLHRLPSYHQVISRDCATTMTPKR
jgi:hypothetical protein